MVGGGGELVVRYGTSMVGRVMVIAALVASFAQKSIASVCVICYLAAIGCFLAALYTPYGISLSTFWIRLCISWDPSTSRFLPVHLRYPALVPSLFMMLSPSTSGVYSSTFPRLLFLLP